MIATKLSRSVSTYFDTLTPWAMHFALSAYTVADPRPPTGSPLLSAREWWRDNMFVITAFREHFEERSSLGDAPEFGPGIDGISPETRETIRAILARVSHPLRQRASRQRSTRRGC